VLTTIKRQALLVASVVVFAGLIAPVSNAFAESQPASVEAMFAALGEGRFDVADAIAAQLDANAEDKSLFSTFSRATRLVAGDDCASGGPLAETVVSRSPLFLPAYDLIAKCLVQAGDPEKAAAMFDDVASRLNKGAERDQILARAQSLRPDMSAKYSVDVNLMPSTNVNRGTDNTDIGVFKIDEGARTKAGVSASVFGTVDKPIYVSKHLISSISLRAGVTYNIRDDTSLLDLNQIFPSARLALTTRYLLSPQTSVGAVLAYDHVHKGTAFESASPSVAVDVAHQVSPTLSLGARAEIAYTHHNDANQTGWTAGLNANASYTILPNDRLTVAATFVREDRKAAKQSYNQIGLSAEWEHAFQSGYIGSLGGEASYRLYEANAPLTSDKQHNIQARATIGISHRNFMIGKFRPELAYTFTKQWSNDAFSDFTAHDVSVRAKAAF
jgi:Surface lipoprotein assembly modifier